ncbi:MAG: hypothetical protein Q9162_006804 [Coniocarpon cinnabarinum]
MPSRLDATNGTLESQTNVKTNGYPPSSNGQVHSSYNEDTFQHLPKQQQDVLVLHGPRQKYTLQATGEVPDLRTEREILIQVFGPSTDYRDVRKAAYQEYLVTTDFNVARLPASLSVNVAAALGVAFVSAFIALGVSLGFNFARIENDHQGPDLFSLLQKVNSDEVPEDVQEETFTGIRADERPKRGDWFAIWGASSNTGLIAVQLAKFAGLRVVAVADAARHGAKLYSLGTDILVDRHDPFRAIEIIRSVTNGHLRFALDTVGKETAAHLQESLQQSTTGAEAHIVGLTGLPKSGLPGIKYHSVPIKLFHKVPAIGESAMDWLEQLLVQESLQPPEVDTVEGGLEGINGALDRLRSGAMSSKRLVVPIEGNKSQESLKNGLTNGVVKPRDPKDTLEYADNLNADPSRIKFAYWVPNVSGGLVISKIPQRTSWDLDANARYAQTAEHQGFEYALTQIRFMAGYGAENQHESVSFSQALLHHTERLKVMAALLPGPWNPAVAAKQIASIDNYSKGRIAVNVVSGWFKLEFTSIGQWWLDHSERYRRSRELISCLKGIWTQDVFNFKGDFYQFHDYPLKPKPVSSPGRTHPEIFQGGNSNDARENAAAVSDYYFMNGNTLDGFRTQIKDVKERAKQHGREGEVQFAVNAFVIARETEAAAVRILQEIQGKADKDAVDAFAEQVQNAGASTSNKTGMWASSKFNDLVQYNDGFKTKLIGTPQQIADRILLIKSLGVQVLLVAFLHYEDDVKHFGEQVLALVRKLEAEGRGKDEAYEISLTGDVYRE